MSILIQLTYFRLSAVEWRRRRWRSLTSSSQEALAPRKAPSDSLFSGPGDHEASDGISEFQDAGLAVTQEILIHNSSMAIDIPEMS